MVGDKSERAAELGKEIHALSCASKPLAGWIARDAIQECREACGGHGYFGGKILGASGGHFLFSYSEIWDVYGYKCTISSHKILKLLLNILITVLYTMCVISFF